MTTILERLGGSRFQTSTGARDFVGHDEGLTFRIPQTKRGINRISITRSQNDTYTVTFFRVVVSQSVEIVKVSDVAADQLLCTVQREAAPR